MISGPVTIYRCVVCCVDCTNSGGGGGGGGGGGVGGIQSGFITINSEASKQL